MKTAFTNSVKFLVEISMIFLLCVPVFAQSEHTFHANGSFAYANFCNDLGCGSVQVARGGTVQDPQLFLTYWATQFRPEGYVAYYGWGIISVASLHGGGSNVQRLSVDTNAAGIFGTTCTTTWEPYSYDCSPFGGTISLDWKQNGLSTNDRLVNETSTWTGYSSHRIGRESSGSADVAGTVFGSPVSSTWGWVGVMRDTIIEISRSNQLTVASTLDEMQNSLTDPAVGGRRKGPALNKADYTFSFVDCPGAARTRLFGINDQGQIAGSYMIPGVGQHGFVLSNGQCVPLEPQSAIASQARGINNAGQVVGLFTDANENSHGFLFANGAYQVLDYPGEAYQGRTQATGIAADGTIVGQVLADEGVFGFVLKDGVYTRVQCERAGNTQPTGIAPNGTIVGACDTDVPWSFRGFIMQSGITKLYDVPGAAATALLGTNAAGAMVGFYTIEDTYATAHGFLHDGTNLLLLDVPNAAATRLQGINASGQVVGFIDSGAHGVLGTPGNSQKPIAQ